MLHFQSPGQTSPLKAVHCITYIQIYIYEIVYLEREREILDLLNKLGRNCEAGPALSRVGCVEMTSSVRFKVK